MLRKSRRFSGMGMGLTVAAIIGSMGGYGFTEAFDMAFIKPDVVPFTPVQDYELPQCIAARKQAAQAKRDRRKVRGVKNAIENYFIGV